MQLAVETLLDQCRSASKIWQHTYHGVNFFFFVLEFRTSPQLIIYIFHPEHHHGRGEEIPTTQAYLVHR